jgi:aconitate hydratase
VAHEEELVTWQQLDCGGTTARYMPLPKTAAFARLPYALRVLLENLLRQQASGAAVGADVADLLARRAGARVSFAPARVYGQDILGKVMMVDLAALRDALAAADRDPLAVNPAVPVDIVVDHSLQVDFSGTRDAPRLNLEIEYKRNAERFAFLRWCSESFRDVRVVPPGKGIMHQIHIEKLARVVWTDAKDGAIILSPDTCVGTDSHTPMVNGLGVLGWGVGGIEAEAVMLGRPVAMALPRVVGVELSGGLPDGVLPTDLVLHITEALRKKNVVGQFVEFFGAALPALPVADRATIANMAPEYGATVAFFPIDRRTIDYLRMTARDAAHIATVEAYAKAQGLWRDGTAPDPVFDDVVTIDLNRIRPSIAGPKNPEDRIDLSDVAQAFPAHCQALAGRPPVSGTAGAGGGLKDGDIVIAAITSCTNTSNPAGMIAAGLLARKAVAAGLTVPPRLKTSFAPGSHVVAAVLERTGLQADLDALGFQVVGYGCTTCNGGSGPLAASVSQEIEAKKIVATAVLSGNRNFQGRIHPNVRAAYLASPALVVAYAIAGSIAVDIVGGPLGVGKDGKAVHLKDVWPSAAEIAALVESAYRPDIFAEKYEDLFDGGEAWNELLRAPSALFPWRSDSTYVRQPPYFQDLAPEPAPPRDIRGARALVILGDSVNTDDISPSGAIDPGTPSADFLLGLGVRRADFNNYTARRANHEVAIRATFANIRLRNRMVPGIEGGTTVLQPEGETMRIFDAAQRYKARGTPLLVFAGKNYGCGSSRDWAAKGVALLGVKAVVATEFERIHRTNLVGMGVLPLQFADGYDADVLALNGGETFDILGLERDFGVRERATLRVARAEGRTDHVALTIRLDTPEDVDTWRNGGILPSVWREYMRSTGKSSRSA